jgi:hypothetical protein
MSILLDDLELPNGGNYTLKNDVYVLTRGKQLKCRLIGSGGTTIRFLVGKAGEQALQTVAGCDTAGSENIIWEIAPGCYAVGGEGGFKGLNSQIHGTGGFCGGAYHLHGNTHKNQFINWQTVDTVKDSYAGYAGPAITDKPGEYSAKNNVGVELINCAITKGVVGQYHGLRFHGCDKIVIHGGRFVFAPDPKHYTAALRVHDNGDCEIIGATFTGGNFAFGPMQEEDGGKNLPPGPKRDYYDAMRLKKLLVKDSTFDGLGLGTFKFNCGVLDGELDNVNILNVYGSSIAQTPAPYMNRPLSTVRINGGSGTLAKPDRNAKLFSDDGGAKNIRVAGFTFNGKTVTH